MDTHDRSRWLGFVILAIVLATARADYPVPSNLVALSEMSGQAMLLDATYRADYFQLGQHFVTQINNAFCGPASSVMVLNALGVPRPIQDPNAGFLNPNYAYYTQVNVFDNATEKVVPQALVRQQGMALSELSGFLAAHQGVSSSYMHSGPTLVPLDQFRQAIINALALPNAFVIVNFDRSVLMEYGSGHHSPIAAYHQDSDSVLVLDVSRYKYVAWWVSVDQLYHSTSTTVDSSTNLTRGLCLVWATDQYGPKLPPGLVGMPLRTDNGLPYVQAMHGIIATHSHDDEESDGLSPAAASGLAIGMLVAGAMLGLVGALAWQRARREHRQHSSSGGMDFGAAGKLPWPASVYGGYRDGVGLNSMKGSHEERGLLHDSSSDASSKV